MTLLRILYPSLTWRIPTKEKILYLTFDDGPHPEITPFVLDLLKSYHANATFFCIGENVDKYPDTYRAILAAGHAVGNHTYNHLNGWKTKTVDYLNNISLSPAGGGRGWTTLKLFRPPFGRITPSQIKSLNHRHSIIMWDILTRDWDKRFTSEQCFQRVQLKASPGSIIVFHDSLKAEERMKSALKQTLDYFSERGFQFHAIPV